jgi:Glycosyl transferases group 1
MIMANRLMPCGDVEGFGIVFLEAAACGKPVIAGASGGTAEAVRDGESGLLVDGSSAAAIARAVVELATDSARRDRMGEAGRRVVLAPISGTRSPKGSARCPRPSARAQPDTRGSSRVEDHRRRVRSPVSVPFDVSKSLGNDMPDSRVRIGQGEFAKLIGRSARRRSEFA